MSHPLRPDPDQLQRWLVGGLMLGLLLLSVLGWVEVGR